MRKYKFECYDVETGEIRKCDSPVSSFDMWKKLFSILKIFVNNSDSVLRLRLNIFVVF